ncbi:MAG TPA: hypothetical protein VIJ86_05005 [Acidimicrobiales bacterium]
MIADRTAAVRGFTIDPDLTGRQHVGERQPVAIDRSAQDLGDGGTVNMVVAYAGRFTRWAEQQYPAHERANES